MRLSGECLRGSALALSATLALGACATKDRPGVEGLTRETAGVHLRNGQGVNLEPGTLVTAVCVSGGPFNLRASINSGEYKGSTAEDVPRGALIAFSDPYKAYEETPPQDPFGPLPPCYKS